MKPYSVLIVDDEAPARTLVRIALEDELVEVSEATNADEAWSRMLAAPPDLLVCDQVMPGMTGIELVRRMRAEPALRHVSVLMVTGHNTLEVTLDAVEVGADDFVTKPWDPDSLRVRVLALLRRRQRNRRRTLLPTGNAIPRALESRVASGAPYAAFFIRFGSFQAFAYKFGWSWAEASLQRFSTILRDAFTELGGDDAFVGHAIREHFVALTRPDAAEASWNLFLDRFDRARSSLFDKKDIARGFLCVVDETGMPLDTPLPDPGAVLVEGPRKGVERAGDLTRLVQAASASSAASTASPGRDLVRL